MMIYIDTVPFAYLILQHRLLWNVVFTANIRSVDQHESKVIKTFYHDQSELNIMITNMILLKGYVTFNTLLSASVSFQPSKK